MSNIENLEANRVVRLIRTHARWGGNLEETQKLIRDLIANNWWQERHVSGKTKTYENFAAFCEDKAEHGLETDIKIIKRLAEKDPETGRLFREVTTAPNHRPRLVSSDNITTNSERGTSKSYLATRLNRDHPEIYEEVLAGDLTVYAAAVKAGIKKRNFSIPMDSKSAAERIIKRFSFNEIVRLRDLLSIHIEEKE